MSICLSQTEMHNLWQWEALNFSQFNNYTKGIIQETMYSDGIKVNYDRLVLITSHKYGF